ncbi:MAG: flagellar hook-associated protein FlgK [Bryobacterales bacterium]|nr:flagellar hook-associated protein FlgK [Bryobacterales bacterium]
MGNLFATINTAAGSLKAFESALGVASNNITNAQTPGFARQSLDLVAQRMVPQLGLPGGVAAGEVLSSRKTYLEQGVRLQLQREGYFRQQAANLEQVEPVFDIGASSGIAGAADALQQSFSQLSVTPNDVPARQNVLRRAQDLAHAFNTTGQALASAATNTNSELTQSVHAVNRIGKLLRNLNVEFRSDSRKLSDPGLDAQVHASLDELASIVDFNLIRGDDGTFTVLLGGQTPLVMGENLYEISTDLSTGSPVLWNAQGEDVTGRIGGGKLKALIDFHADVLTGLQQDLDVLALSITDAVNGQLQTGVDLAGQPPIRDLFTYDPSRGAAVTLSVTEIGAGELAAAVPEAPGGNGNALNLAGLFQSRSVNNFTFTQYFGEIAGRVGKLLDVARQDARAQTQLVAQAKALRADQSGVSLDEEAANLIVFQRAYQAASQLIRTLDEMTETLINMKR